MNSNTDVQVFRRALLCFALGVSAASAQAAYPVKPVRFIAPFPPGGTTDVLSRILAQKLTDGPGPAGCHREPSRCA